MRKRLTTAAQLPSKIKRGSFGNDGLANRVSLSTPDDESLENQCSPSEERNLDPSIADTTN